MGKIILATGPTGSGKTRWLSKWQKEDPEKREIVYNIADAHRALASGKDVGIEIGSFGAHEVELKVFN